MIKGVGPKLEIMLNELGLLISIKSQVGAAEVAWVNDNLTGFRAVSAAMVGRTGPQTGPGQKQSFPNAFLMEMCTRRA